jgi:hypothetical protein
MAQVSPTNPPLTPAAAKANGGEKAESHEFEPDYPRPDGRFCHDDFPDKVPSTWTPETINKAIEAIEESIGERQWEEDWLGPDTGHQDRIDKETEWLGKLKERLIHLTRASIGGVAMAMGARLVYAGTTASIIILADDCTVLGVADNILLVGTGGMLVFGGTMVAVGSIIEWVRSW